ASFTAATSSLMPMPATVIVMGAWGELLCGVGWVGFRFLTTKTRWNGRMLGQQGFDTSGVSLGHCGRCSVQPAPQSGGCLKLRSRSLGLFAQGVDCGGEFHDASGDRKVFMVADQRPEAVQRIFGSGKVFAFYREEPQF